MNKNLTKKVDNLLASNYLFNNDTLSYTLACRVEAYLYTEVHQKNTLKRREYLDKLLLNSNDFKEVVSIANGIILALEFDM